MISLGVDIAQNKIDVALYDTEDKQNKMSATFVNKIDGYIALFDELHENKIDIKKLLVYMESTGGLEEPFFEFIREKVGEAYILNAKQVKSFKETLGLDQKTDLIDAKALAMMVVLPSINNCLKANADSLSNELVALISQRNFLIGERTRAIVRKQRIFRIKKGLAGKFIVKQLQSVIENLDKEIKNIDNEITNFINTNNDFANNVGLLKLIPGIGEKTANLLVSYLGAGAELFNNADKFAAYSGLYPTENSSGVFVGKKKLSRKGCRALKKALYLCALSAVRREGKLKNYYQAKVADGKEKKQVLIAMANKLAKVSWSVIKHQQKFDETKFLPSFA
jgi:transposase